VEADDVDPSLTDTTNRGLCLLGAERPSLVVLGNLGSPSAKGFFIVQQDNVTTSYH